MISTSECFFFGVSQCEVEASQDASPVGER